MAVQTNDNVDNAGAREQLLEAASQIMRDGDVVDLSLSELSLRSGLNSALVKYYFGNKNGLMQGLLERDMTNVVNGLQALVLKDMEPQDKLRLHIGAVIDTYYAFPYLNRLLMRILSTERLGACSNSVRVSGSLSTTTRPLASPMTTLPSDSRT